MQSHFNENQTLYSDRLESLGLGTYYHAKELENGTLLGRVLSRKGTRYEIATRSGIVQAEISGRLSHSARNEGDIPVVGDWVRVQWSPAGDAAALDAELAVGTPNLGLVTELLPRKGALARGKAGSATESQIMAANVNTMFIVWSLETMAAESSPDRMRWGGILRFLTLAEAGEIEPALILSKADTLRAEIQVRLRERARELRKDLPVLLIGGLGGSEKPAPAPEILNDLADIVSLTPPASTSVLVGLSGVGKSTIVNALLSRGDGIRTSEVRGSDLRGRHTTTHREMYFLPHGALLIDSPGVREIGVRADEGDLNASFEGIAGLALSCRFSDCRHEREPGCAVRQAILEGRLDGAVLAQYLKQLSELRKAESRAIKSGKAQATDRQIYEAGEDDRRWKAIHKSMKNFSKENRSGS